MKLIIGLGNPGIKYQTTRHNAGFLAMDYILKDLDTISCVSKFKGHVCEAHFTATNHPKGPVKVFFVKPQTYMNNSGEAVAEIVEYYRLNPEKDLLVIHDELDLKFGYWKPAFDSRAAGHNGVQSIIDHLGTQKFTRFRIGVESRKSRFDQATDEYVLTQFSETELTTLENQIFPDIKSAVTEFIFKQ